MVPNKKNTQADLAPQAVDLQKPHRVTLYIKWATQDHLCKYMQVIFNYMNVSSNSGNIAVLAMTFNILTFIWNI